MTNKVISIAGAVIAAASAIAVNTVLHPCRGEMAMQCVRTTQIGTVVLAATVLLYIASLLAKHANLKKILTGLTVLAAAAVFFVPVLGHCGGAMMHCNTHTMPAFRIAGAVLFVDALAVFAAQFLHKKTVNAA